METQIFGETEALCHPFISIKPQFSLGSRQSWLFAKFCCPLAAGYTIVLLWEQGRADLSATPSGYYGLASEVLI